MVVDPRDPDSAPLEARRAHSMKALSDLRDILDIVLLAGKLLLESGAETWRVEDAIHRLGCGLGADSMETLPPTAIMVNGMKGGENAQHHPGEEPRGDLSRVGAVRPDSLRDAGEPDPQRCEHRLRYKTHAARLFHLMTAAALRRGGPVTAGCRRRPAGVRPGLLAAAVTA